MISFTEVIPIGQIIKLHGINGEMAFMSNYEGLDFDNIPFLIFDMHGILVPFYLKEWRFNSENSGFLKIEDVDNEKKAKNFLGLTIYLHKKFLNILESDVDMDNNTFIEFRIFDKDNNFIGIVTDIDTSTQNVLFIVDNGEKQILIPACEDYILQIDEMKKIIYMDLPEGLLEL